MDGRTRRVSKAVTEAMTGAREVLAPLANAGADQNGQLVPNAAMEAILEINDALAELQNWEDGL